MARAVNNFRLFFQGALLSYVALFRWLRPVTYMASKVLLPLNQMLFFTLLGTFATGRDNAHFYVIGNAIQVADPAAFQAALCDVVKHGATVEEAVSRHALK